MDIIEIVYKDSETSQHPGWEGCVRDLAARTDLDHKERAQLEAALQYFRRELGDEWPGWRHHWPLATQFYIRYNNALPLGVWLYLRGTAIAGIPNAGSVIRGLGDHAWEKFAASQMELSIAAAGAALNLAIEFPEPERNPTPDVRIHVDGRPLSIECHRMQANDDERRGDALLDRLKEWSAELGLDQRGELTIEYDDDVHVEDATAGLEHVRRAMGELARRGAGQISIPGMARISFDSQKPPRAHPVVEPPYIDNSQTLECARETRRLVNRVPHKSRQLNTPGATLLVVQVRSILWPHRDVVAALRQLGNVLRGAFRKTGIGGVLVHEDMLASGRSRCALLEHEPEMSMLVHHRDGLRRCALLVRNPNARVPLSAAEVAFFINDAPAW